MTQTLTSRDPSDPLFQPVRDSDPATPGDPLSRLRFHYGQCLSAEDFETEQRYFVLRQRLHNALLHGVGTVWGLAIRRREPKPTGGDQLICEPGMAIDPLGREIWVPQTLCLDLAALETSFWEQLKPLPAPEEASKEVSDAPAGADAQQPGQEDKEGESTPAGPAASPFKSHLSFSSPESSNPPPASGTDPAGGNDTPFGGQTTFPEPAKTESSAPPDEGPSAPPSPSPGARRAYVVLRYEACLTDAVPVIPLPCGDEHEGLAPSRLRDSFRLCLEAEAPYPDATVRDITQRPLPAEPRERLLRHALNDPPLPATLAPLERFWSGADDAGLLLASLDLKASGLPSAEGLQPVSLLPADAPASNPDNAVRAVLPAVQALADLALGIRLEGRATAAPPFQVLGVSAKGVKANGTALSNGETAEAIQIEIALSDRPLVDANLSNQKAALQQAVQLWVWNSSTSAWREVTENSSPEKPTAWEVATEQEAPAIRLRLQQPWTTSTSFQVVLKGTGANALMAASTPHRPLAGVAGELVPAGCGRDAHLFATYTPST